MWEGLEEVMEGRNNGSNYNLKNWRKKELLKARTQLLQVLRSPSHHPIKLSEMTSLFESRDHFSARQIISTLFAQLGLNETILPIKLCLPVCSATGGWQKDIQAPVVTLVHSSPERLLWSWKWWLDFWFSSTYDWVLGCITSYQL